MWVFANYLQYFLDVPIDMPPIANGPEATMRSDLDLKFIASAYKALQKVVGPAESFRFCDYMFFLSLSSFKITLRCSALILSRDRIPLAVDASTFCERKTNHDPKNCESAIQ